MVMKIGRGQTLESPNWDKREVFSYAMKDANSNGLYDQPDVDAAKKAIGKTGIPGLNAVAEDIAKSEARIISFGEHHNNFPFEILLAVAEKLKKKGKNVIIASEWPKSLFQPVADGFQDGLINETEFKKRLVKKIMESDYCEMKDPPNIRKEADFVIKAYALGVRVEYIDERPSECVDYGKYIASFQTRDSIMKDRVITLLGSQKNTVVLTSLGGGHGMERYDRSDWLKAAPQGKDFFPPYSLAQLLSKELEDKNLLSLYLVPVFGNTRGTPKNKLPEVGTVIMADELAAMNTKFNSFDYILPYAIYDR